MNCLRLNICHVLVAGVFALGAGGQALAQSEPEEELELIVLDEQYDEQYDDTDSDEEVAVMDDQPAVQSSQQYQLIEDPEDEDLVEPPSQRETDTAEIIRLFAVYKEAVSSKNFLEADTLAKQIIELSIKVFGIDSEESAKSLTNLAIAQHGNREFEAAERNYLSAIDIIERISDDSLNASLINPLKGLGATQLALGRPKMAQSTFQRAVHLSHVNEGPHNLDQIEVLESMAEISLAVGEHKEAQDLQEKMFSLQARNIPVNSLDVLPALNNQAHWQHRLQLYERERATWRRVISVIEQQLGKEHLQLIPPLTNLGNSYLFVTPVEFDMQPEISVSSGESYLRRANRIADSNPDADWQLLERTLLSLGDYYVMSGRPNRASRIYEELWVMLSEDAEKLGDRRDNLEKPNVLQPVYPPKYYRGEQQADQIPDTSNFETGIVSFGFTINSSGRPTNIIHLETQPAEFEEMRQHVLRNIRHLVYRPRVEEGRMVERPEMTYVHEFYYRPGDIPVAPEADEPASR